MTLKICGTWAGILLFAVPLLADVVTASGAGPLPASAEDLSGDTSLSEIIGTLDFPDGVNVFRIDIPNPLEFSARTVDLPFGVASPELFLFDSNGFGVYADEPSINPQACLPSLVFNPCPDQRGGVGPITSGTYFLAITREGNSPLADSGAPIFPFLSDVTGPILPTSTVAGWDNGVFTGTNFDLTQYDIVISDTPEPGFLGLVGGLLLLAGARVRSKLH